MARKRAEPDSPTRCQAATSRGQCTYEALPGNSVCARHGGGSAEKARKNALKRMYDLACWQGRMNEFAESDASQTLREEIGIARMVLENLVRSCKSPTDIILQSGKIGDMVSRIERLVTACHGIEIKLGMMLDKGAALALASRFIDIIGVYVSDEDTLNKIGSELAAAVAGAKPEATDA